MIDKKILIQRLKTVDNIKMYRKIFKIIIDKDIKYTKNSNGIFFNIDLLDEKTLFEIEKLITYYECEKVKIHKMLNHNM